MSVMQLSIMEHNGIYLKEKLLLFASIEVKHNGVSFEHNFLMPSPKPTVVCTLGFSPPLNFISAISLI